MLKRKREEKEEEAAEEEEYVLPVSLPTKEAKKLFLAKTYERLRHDFNFYETQCPQEEEAGEEEEEGDVRSFLLPMIDVLNDELIRVKHQVKKPIFVLPPSPPSQEEEEKEEEEKKKEETEGQILERFTKEEVKSISYIPFVPYPGFASAVLTSSEIFLETLMLLLSDGSVIKCAITSRAYVSGDNVGGVEEVEPLTPDCVHVTEGEEQLNGCFIGTEREYVQSRFFDFVYRVWKENNVFCDRIECKQPPPPKKKYNKL